MSSAIAQTKIIVGMSGGVDSSVAALLLLEQGYQVEGLFMKNWDQDDDDDYCPAAEDAADARSVCDKLGIPLHTINFSEAYWEHVFSHFLQEYQAGRTPNPDILCNKEIKFNYFLRHARELGADYIATGHYVRRQMQHGSAQLLQGLDPGKDQSYFLYALTPEQIAASLFPIGEYQKSEVRHIAAKAGFLNHDKRDSTGICFIGERKFKAFLSQYLPAQPGPMKTPEGNVIGQHDGLMFYTLGQRKGLGIGGRQDGSEQAWYVADKDLANNTLIVVQGQDHPLLFARKLLCQQLNWIEPPPTSSGFACTAKTRYRQAQQTCHIQALDQHTWEVSFPQPQRAVTPGQSVVFYQDDHCLGGGIITAFYR